MTSTADRLFDADRQMQAGALGWLLIVAICAFASWHVLTNVWLIEPGRWQNCIHFGGFALLAAFTTAPVNTDKSGAQKSGLSFAQVANLLFLSLIHI